MKTSAKKIAIGCVLLLVLIIMYYSYSKQSLPIPDFPLAQTDIANALQDVGFNWSIGEEQLLAEGQNNYELRGDDGKLIAFISSVQNSETRLLQISFFSSSAISSPLPEEDWDDALVLAAILYGGFNGKQQLRESFQNTYESNMTSEIIVDASPDEKEVIRWRSEVNHYNCFVGMRRTNLNEATPITNLIQITISPMNSNTE